MSDFDEAVARIARKKAALFLLHVAGSVASFFLIPVALRHGYNGVLLLVLGARIEARLSGWNTKDDGNRRDARDTKGRA